MKENTENKKKHNEEEAKGNALPQANACNSNAYDDRDMDLIDLIRVCWRGFVKYIFRPLEFCFRFALKRWWQLAIIAVAAVAISISYNMWINPTYVMTVKLNNRYASAQYYVDEVNSLAKDPAAISMNLGIDKNNVKNIKRLTAFLAVYADSTQYDVSVMDKDNEFLSGKKTNKFGFANKMFYLYAESSSKELLDSLDRKVVKYLSNTEYVQTSINNQLPLIEERINTFEVEAEKLDSLREKLYFSDATIIASGMAIQSQQTQLLTDQILRVNSDLATWKSEYSQIKKALVYLTKPEIVLDYNIRTCATHAVIAVLAGFAIMLCISYRKKIKEYVNS